MDETNETGVETPPPVTPISWDYFRLSGMLWWVNRILHTLFGVIGGALSGVLVCFSPETHETVHWRHVLPSRPWPRSSRDGE